jgi:hypothetical protein
LPVENKTQIFNALLRVIAAVVEALYNQAILVDKDLLADLCGEVVASKNFSLVSFE